MTKKDDHRNSEYWEERIANETWRTYNQAEDKNRDLITMYDKTSKAIKDELYAIAEKAELQGGLTRSQQYRFNKLLGQQGVIYQEIEKLGSQAEKHGTKLMLDAGESVYCNIMDQLEIDDFKQPNKKMMEQMMRSPWHGSFFSKRLWKDMGALEQSLNGVINDGVATGKTVTEMAVQLSNIMNKSFNDAHRLVRSETINYMNRSALRGYKDAGITKIQWWAAEDERTCETCGKNHSKPYDDIDKAPNLPCHVGCRCTWLPIIEDTSIDAENIDIPKFAKNRISPKVVNTEKEVDSYLSKMTIKTSNSKVLDVIRYDISMIPKRDLELLSKYPLEIKESMDGRTFFRMSKLSGKNSIFINGDSARTGTFAHEFAHFSSFRTELYKDSEFIKVLENSVKGSTLSYKKFGDKSQVIVVSDNFVSLYQGRTYITVEEFEKSGKLELSDLKEYVSVGYECFITNPQLLYEKDKKLYEFFKERGLANGKK